jgi:hypothetical protein
MDMNRAIEAEIPFLQRYALEPMRDHTAAKGDLASCTISRSRKSVASREGALSASRNFAAAKIPGIGPVRACRLVLVRLRHRRQNCPQNKPWHSHSNSPMRLSSQKPSGGTKMASFLSERMAGSDAAFSPREYLPSAN